MFLLIKGVEEEAEKSVIAREIASHSGLSDKGLHDDGDDDDDDEVGSDDEEDEDDLIL